MQQVFFIHGGSAYTEYADFIADLHELPLRSPSNEDEVQKWSKKLRFALGDTFETFTPSMPNSDNAKYEEWKIWFERHFQYLHDGVILIGWSLGGSFLARYLSENETPFKVKALLLLAAPYHRMVVEGEREDGEAFYPQPEKVPSLIEKINVIHILHSKDDFLVPYSHGEAYKAALPKATLHTFEDKNHFLVEQLPELVALVKELDEK